ncbi:MAG: lipocalin family protein [Betaproteobacteria bacterium]
MRRPRPFTPSAFAGACALCALALSAPAFAQDSLGTVDKVDLSRYAGTWFEIARLPNKLQAECAGDVTTSFTRRGMNTFDIVTRCRRKDGSEEVDNGIARVRDTSTNAKMEWRFLPLALAWWPFAWSDYWIVDLAPDYSYAMAAAPTRESMWILARTADLDAANYARLVAKARTLGFDTDKLIRTRHSAP